MVLAVEINKKIQIAIEQLGEAETRERGAIFTRPEVVDFILDLAGYTPDKDLSKKRLLEPSCGKGDFLLIALNRLLNSFFSHGGNPSNAVTRLLNSLAAVEVHPQSFKCVHKEIIALLTLKGISNKHASILADSWLHSSDFLLLDLPDKYDFVVGNPPYIRQELIPDALLMEYRRRFRTIYDRADLYIPFIEKSLSLLSPTGKLAFICSNRWMKNRYGGPLRKLISESFNLDYYVDMEQTPAFQSDVIAYTAITIISHQKGREGITRVAFNPPIDSPTLTRLADSMKGPLRPDNQLIGERKGFAQGAEPWLLDGNGEIKLVRKLEGLFPTIEETGCNIGIGVATGCDKAYIGILNSLDVEECRKLPIIMAPDIKTGEIRWSGKGVINPFEDDGSVVNLDKYPRLKAHIFAHKEQIDKRNVAKRNPTRWYRTIDRIYRELVSQPKLLIPDIKGCPNVVFDDGKFYPHHNLYYVTSHTWDLKSLQTVLNSSIAKLFVMMYSVRMRGGYLRFQAQNLRRIRLPRWEDVPANLRKKLKSAGSINEPVRRDEIVFDLYGLSEAEREIVREAVQ